MKNTIIKEHEDRGGILAKVFLAVAVIAAGGIGSAFANTSPDGPADCPAVGDICNDGTIYVGSAELTGRDDSALGSFDLFAAPQDLSDDQGNRLLLTFNDAVEHVAGLRNWHGHDGGRFESDAALYAAISDGRYAGEWFIPPKYVLRESIYWNREEGALRGTFVTRYDGDGSGIAHWYWSCSESGGETSYAWAVIFTAGDNAWSHKDLHSFSSRLVRAEPRP